MKVGSRRFPAGVSIQQTIDLQRFLPYRIHLLATKIASPPTVSLEDGTLIRTRDWRVIVCLGAFGPLTNREIGNVVGMDAASITRAVQHLVDSGLVVTQVSRVDRRKQLISLTPKGALAHDSIAPHRKAASDKIESALTPKERELFYVLLDKLSQRIAELDTDDIDEWGE